MNNLTKTLNTDLTHHIIFHAEAMCEAECIKGMKFMSCPRSGNVFMVFETIIDEIMFTLKVMMN